MKTLRHHLEKLREIKRRHHPLLIHKIHKRYGISKKTLFYVKEYGPHANVPRTIFKESIKILLLVSLISSFGGLALEQIKLVFISIIPLVILMPILNDMIGDYGTIMSAKLSTMLHEGKLKRNWWAIKELKTMFAQVFIISMLTAGCSSFLAVIVSSFSSYNLSAAAITKIMCIAFIDVALLVAVLFIVALFAGIYLYKKKEDPNNFLIPITTSIADFGNMSILTILIILFF